MPRGDRTGPEGEGPMTGRQAGFCAGNDVPGYAERRSVGRGFGGQRFAGPRFVGRRSAGRGAAGRGGYRWRNWFYATGVPGWARFDPNADVPTEAESLKTQAEWLRGELDAIGQRLQELDKQE